LTQAIEELQAEDRVLEIARLFPRQGEWTEEDYFKLPETNRIIELSEGRLIISPSPTPRHQRISGNLFPLIRNYVKSNSLGEVCYSPLDVRLWKGKIRQPDIAFMSKEHKERITEELWGIPDLVVEILSESTAKRDKGKKYREYQKAGIPEYWIVDPFQQTIDIYTLENKAYTLLGKYGAGEIAYSKLLAGFQVAVNSVFE
jgi:Uma2 family endonuclease